jgi:hypothetical protein
MKITKEIEIPAKKEKRLIGFVCDICKKEFPSDGHFFFEDRSRSEFGVQSVTVTCESGEIYPDNSGNTDKMTYDICAGCFKEKIMPELKNLGADTPHIEEIYYGR